MNYDKFKLPLIFATLGFIFTTTKWIQFINNLDPLVGIILYYVLLFVIIIIMEYFGLVVGGIKFDSFKRTLGTILIVFAFFITVDLQSCYIRTIVNKKCHDEKGLYSQSEDGIIYWLWSKLFDNIQIRRILTYVVTPFTLAYIGLLLIDDEIVTLSPVRFKKT